MTYYSDNQPTTFITHITDTTDDNAALKIRSAYVNHTRRHKLRADDIAIVGAATTTDIGFKVSELLNNTERPERLVIATNAAPAEKKEGTEGNARSNFFFAKLRGPHGGIDYVGGTLRGSELAYVANRVLEVWELKTTNDLQSPFRSLQVLPEHLVKFAIDDENEKLQAAGALTRVDVDLHEPTVTHVVEVDNFGNVKLFITEGDRRTLEAATTRGEKVTIAFERAIRDREGAPAYRWQFIQDKVRPTPTLFRGKDGETVIALASSSTLDGARAVPFLATVRSDPASTRPAYKLPKVGAAVLIQTIRS